MVRGGTLHNRMKTRVPMRCGMYRFLSWRSLGNQRLLAAVVLCSIWRFQSGGRNPGSIWCCMLAGWNTWCGLWWCFVQAEEVLMVINNGIRWMKTRHIWWPGHTIHESKGCLVVAVVVLPLRCSPYIMVNRARSRQVWTLSRCSCCSIAITLLRL